MSNGYYLLRHRAVYPDLYELQSYLHKAAVAMYTHSFGEVMQIEIEQDTAKLKSSANHLNDHILRFRCRLPSGVKDVAFVLGISDFDKAKGYRVEGNAHA